MFGIPHNPELRSLILGRVRNEYLTSKVDLDLLLSANNLEDDRKRLLACILKSCTWYQLIAALHEKELRDALNTEVIHELWPTSLRSRFVYVADLLYGDTVSTAG